MNVIRMTCFKFSTTSPVNKLFFRSIFGCHFQRQIADKREDISTVPSVNDERDLKPELDWAYICNPSNKENIEKNISIRKGVGDINNVQRLHKQLEKMRAEGQEHMTMYKEVERKFYKAAHDIPNNTHPDVPIGDETKANIVKEFGTKRDFTFTPRTSLELGQNLNVLRMSNLGLTSGGRSYYLTGQLAQLSDSLVRFVIDFLLTKNFKLISIPDLISSNTVESCGFKTTGERTQVYRLTPELHGDLCLAGTAEIPIAGFFKNKILDKEELPVKLAAVSRCYRAEVSELEREQGLYRVHQFTKVEMFGVTCNDTGLESESTLNEIIEIQTSLYSKLGLPVRVLDMPSEELGAPAYRKYDMETWLPGKQFWGEISSASNCTDYQSRRLGIKYRTKPSTHSTSTDDTSTRFCHTVNGTACAVPRLLMSILENYQKKDGTVEIPAVLQPYMEGQTLIEPSKNLPIKYEPIRLTHTYKDYIYNRYNKNLQ